MSIEHACNKITVGQINQLNLFESFEHVTGVSFWGLRLQSRRNDGRVELYFYSDCTCFRYAAYIWRLSNKSLIRKKAVSWDHIWVAVC